MENRVKKLPPNAGKGRPKGALNKVTSDLREMTLGALAEVGGQKYLAQQAIENPSAFMSLVGKLFPKEIKAEISGHLGICEIPPKNG